MEMIFLSKPMKKILAFFVLISIIGCKEDTDIKPVGQLRLDYPDPVYKTFESDCPFSFEYSKYSKEIKKEDEECWYNINYPEMKANIHLTWFPVKDRSDLATKIKDSEKFVRDQTVKATYISPREFHFPDKKVYGTLFELGGESAINLQFHATDSLHNIISGSVYFSSPPNYDSLQPAIHYMKRDVIRLIETLEWK